MTSAHVDHFAVAEAVNAAINYTMFATFRAAPSASRTGDGRRVLARLSGLDGLRTRGWYDVAGFRSDADVLIWWWSPRPETLQEAYRAVVEETGLTPVWSAMGVHRAAEFNRGHVPAFLAGDEPRGYVCVYPFVRSREWYLLPDDERRELLREHGAAARDYGDVLANTTAAFGLGDYEWLLAFEADELVRIVDLVRDLRATGARRHVLVEVPFFTGPRVTPDELLARLV